MKKLQLAVFIVSAMLLQSCTTVPVAQVGTNEAKQALSFQAEADKAVVYLYRAKKSNYGLFAIDVTFNGKSVSTIGNGFLRVAMEPHEYIVIVDLPELTSKEREFHLNAQPGSITFLEMQLENRLVLGGITSLKHVPKDEAVKYINHAGLIAQVPARL